MKTIFVLGPFTNVGTGEPSGWSLQIRRDRQGNVILSMHWRDKEAPTHDYQLSPEDFKRMMETL